MIEMIVNFFNGFLCNNRTKKATKKEEARNSKNKKNIIKIMLINNNKSWCCVCTAEQLKFVAIFLSLHQAGAAGSAWWAVACPGVCASY
jgi:hypothetical protein